MDPTIRIELREKRGRVIATLTVDNTAKLNTLNSALMTTLAEALEQLASNDRLAAVVLTGAGERAFIGGADITEMAALDAAAARAFITRIHRICEAIRRLPVPRHRPDARLHARCRVGDRRCL